MYKSSYLIHTDQALVVSNPTSDISESLDLEGRTLEEMLNVTALSKRAATKRAVLERIRDSSVLHFCGHGAVAGILKHKIFTSFLEQYALFFLKKKNLFLFSCLRCIGLWRYFRGGSAQTRSHFPRWQELYWCIGHLSHNGSRQYSTTPSASDDAQLLPSWWVSRNALPTCNAVFKKDLKKLGGNS